MTFDFQNRKRRPTTLAIETFEAGNVGGARLFERPAIFARFDIDPEKTRPIVQNAIRTESVFSRPRFNVELTIRRLNANIKTIRFDLNRVGNWFGIEYYNEVVFRKSQIKRAARKSSKKIGLQTKNA